MTDLEILNFLHNIKPESRQQNIKLTKMMSILVNDRSTISYSIKEYLKPVAIDEIIDKSITDIYNHYYSWCTDNGFEPESKKALSQAIMYRYEVKSTVVKINDKSMRVFKL